MLANWWKDLSINFMTGLLISADWKSDSYDSTLIIIDRFIKIVYDELIKVMINAPSLAEVIIDIIIRYHKIPGSNVAATLKSYFKKTLTSAQYLALLTN